MPAVTRRLPVLTAVAALPVLALAASLLVAPPPPAEAAETLPSTARVATYNASLNRAVQGELVADLSTPDDAQAAAVAEVVQRVRPDVLLVNEFDYDDAGRALQLFQDNYLSVARGGAAPIEYAYRYSAPSNTGIASGSDLNGDGRTVTTPGTPGYGDDALGFGDFPGQFGMAVYSRYPIVESGIRTFQDFRWRDMPGNRIPTGFYDDAELDLLPLSSKSHWVVPVQYGDRVVSLVASHPTPPVFDGPEDRNGRRNADEIRMTADLVAGGERGAYLYDDQGRRGGLAPGSLFVVAGDQNSDPRDGDSLPGAIAPLLDPALVNTRATPTSAGGPEAAARQGRANAAHRTDPRVDTADFADGAPGNLRVDYVLPSRGIPIRQAGVFWPVPSDPLSRLTGEFPFPSSDHRLVWVDLRTR